MGAMRSWVPPASYPAGAHGMIHQLTQQHYRLKEMFGHSNYARSTVSDSTYDEDDDDLDE